MPWLGLVAVGISVDIYAMVREAVYGRGTDGRGTDGRGTDGRTNDDREKDVVPIKSLLLLRFKPRTSCAESQCADHYAMALLVHCSSDKLLRRAKNAVLVKLIQH